MAIELNVSRRPFSFGRGSGRGGMAGPKSWKYYDGLAGYSATHVWPILDEMLTGSIAPDALATSCGLRAALSSPEVSTVVSSLKRIQRTLGVEPVPEECVLECMEAAERDGRIGRVAFGSKLTALDCAMGDLKIRKMKASGLAATPPIYFNMDVDFEWEPIDSQRLLLWTQRFGKQDIVARELFRLHFEEQRSLTWRSTLLAASQAAFIDDASVVEFLDGGSLRAEVLHGYDTHMKSGIRWPPFLVLNGPGTNGGPFRDGTRSCMVVRGSPEAFAEAFECIWRKSVAFSPLPPSLADNKNTYEGRRSWKRRRHRQRHNKGYCQES